MSAHLQEIAALALVVLAAAWLAVRLWRQARGKKTGAGCPGCDECGRPSSAPKATPLVTLETRPPRRSSRPEPPSSPPGA